MNINFPPQRPLPQTQKLGPAPDAQDYHKGALAFASAMAVLGAVSSRFTRMSGSQALSAFAGALKGWQQGNLQAYEDAAKKWEQNTKATIDNNNQILEDYKLTLENDKLNIDEQMAELKLKAVKWHDQMMYDATKQNNFTFATKVFEKNWEYTNGPKGIAAASASLLATRQKEQESQALTGERVASGQINPDGINPKTGQPYTETEKQYFKYTKEQYLAGFYDRGKKGKGLGGGLAGQLIAQENSERVARGQEPMNAQEEITFIQSIRPPRSAPAMAVQAFKQDFQAKNGRPPSAEEITKFSSDYARQQSYGRAAGTQSSRVENATNEVALLIPQAIETSHAYLRGKVVPWNRIHNALKAGVSDPTFNDFELANFALINAYTRAMNPLGVPRVNDRLEQHAIGILSTAVSSQAYDTQVRRLWKEVQASKTATAKTAEGVTPGDINSPVPGLDDQTPASNDGWGKAQVVQ